MPTDLASGNAAHIFVRDRYGTNLPFSKGLMATSILATGLATDRAYLVAAKIARHLTEKGDREIEADALSELAGHFIEAHADGATAERYRAWRRTKRTGRPAIIAVSGAPGIGKSTIATRLAVRFGITRVVTTDTIREVLRTVIPGAVLPELHVSTFEGIDRLEPQAKAFARQARAVTAATAAVASRIASERKSAFIEGVHLLPGATREALADHSARPIVVEVLLTLSDRDAHEARLLHRSHHEPDRDGRRHLRHFETIRAVQRTLVEAARESKVVIHDIENPDGLTQHVLDEVIRQADVEAARS